jgi:peptidyl-prolyl cis-trans isomerase C
MKRLSLSHALGLSLPLLAASPLLPVAQAQTKPASPAASAAAPAATQGVAADVNGEKIMTADLNRLVDAIKAQEPGFSAGTPAANKALTELRSQVLDQIITTKLLAQEAKRKKIVADPKQVSDAVANIKSGFKNDAEFRTALSKDGKTPDDLRDTIAEELAIRSLSQQLTSDVTVSNEDISTFYNANLKEFTVPEGVKARHILLAINPNAPEAEKKRVRDRATELIKQLNGKAEFAALAKANSDDPSNKDTGGDLGAFTRGQMVKAFEDAAFSAPVGKIVGPIATDFGFHIIRVDEKIPSKVIPLVDVQKDPGLKAYLLKQKVQKRLDESIAKLKTAAKIKKNV